LHPEQPAPPLPTMGLALPRSACPKCGHHIRWFENIPVLSWLALRGRCSACSAPIAMRYPLVELATMGASLLVAQHFGVSITTVWALVLTWLLIALTGIDFDTQLLPDRITLPLGALGLLVNSKAIFTTPVSAIWGYGLGFLMLWVVYKLFKLITGKEGMGYGDFKLLAALGAWLGAAMLPLIVLLSSLVGAVVGLVLLAIYKKNLPFAFGPYLAIAGWITLLYGAPIMHYYQAAFM
jgi:leader peptidase (prepilin peptidase) / N-methyltransferase